MVYYNRRKTGEYNPLYGCFLKKNSGIPKMDGEKNGKPYFWMDDLGGKPPIFDNSHITYGWSFLVGKPRWVPPF